MPDLNEDRRPRVLLADDHRPILERVAALLAPDFRVVGTATDGVELVDAEAALQPDVMVVDISMPRMSGIEAIQRILRRGSRAVVVCLTAHDEPDIQGAACAAGAMGVVTKTSMISDLVPAIRAALEGRPFTSLALPPPPYTK
jgi:DNA-binding NarL/FixJ family response regulator